MIALWQDRHSEATFECEGSVSSSNTHSSVKTPYVPEFTGHTKKRVSEFRDLKAASPNAPSLHQASSSEFRMQQTVAEVVTFKGVGLHSGAPVQLAIEPAPANSGIQFRRMDVEPEIADIQGRFDLVNDTMLCTKISNADGTELGTVEHLLSALRACEVDNALITMDGPEVPILDGSSKHFFDVIKKTGLDSQPAPRQVIKILAPVKVGDASCGASLVPASGFEVAFKIDFECEAIGEQSFSHTLNIADYKNEIASARTFGFFEDVEKLRSMGLARGGSLDNAVVIQDGAVMNPDGLRFDDEFVRHKILDAIGDLYLAGLQIEGKYVGNCSGHRVNNDLLRALFDQPEAWTLAYQYEPEAVLQAQAAG